MEYYGNLNISPYAQLCHHGVKRMKWGIRNGPPYPLSPTISTGSRLKTTRGGGFREDSGSLFKKKKVKNIRLLRDADFDGDTVVDKEKIRRKEKMFSKADPREVKAHYQEFTNEELSRVIDRIELIDDLNKKIPKDKTAIDKLDDLTKKINSITKFADASIDLYKTSSSVYEIYQSLKKK